MRLHDHHRQEIPGAGEMLIIAEECTFKIGKYTVRQAVRPDNPYWPRYIVFKGTRLVGQQFSRPSESDCEWLERWGARYAEPTISVHPYGWTAATQKRRVGRPRKADAERELQEAIAGA